MNAAERIEAVERRRKGIQLLDAGMTVQGVALALGVSRISVYRWQQRVRCGKGIGLGKAGRPAKRRGATA